MKSWTRRIAATAGAVGLAAWVAGTPGLPALAAASHTDGMATNPYSPSYGHDYRQGAVPTRAQSAKMKGWAANHAGTTSSNTIQYGGGVSGIGVTSSTPKVYIVFWGPWGTQTGSSPATFSKDPAGAAPYLQSLFSGIGTNNEQWSGTMTQYCDGSSVAYGATSCPSGAAHVGYPTGGALADVWYDSTTYPSSNAPTGHQLAAEAVAAAGHFGNTTAASNRYVQYDIVSPTGTNPDGYKTGGFCAWHDYNGDSTLDGGGGVTSPYGAISFTNMPYVSDAGASCGQNFVNSGSAGTLDGFSIVNGHEYAETITDQDPAGGWTNFRSGEENADECAWISPGSSGGAGNVAMATGSFAMQSTWSNDTNSCAISHSVFGGGGGGTTDFNVVDSPTSGSVTVGNSVTTGVSAGLVSGSSESVALTASGLPANATATFNPTSVTSGGTGSTLTIATASNTPTGTYTITITGTAATGTHTATYALTVNPAGSGGSGGNVIVNGGFEDGNFTGWSTSGAAAIFTNPKYDGNYAGGAGYFSPYGTATIAQTFKAAAGDSSLTLWYLTACTGSITYNYSTITLKNLSTGLTATLLNKTCANASAWQSFNPPITPGQSYTLTVTNRDTRAQRNYVALDDVSTS